VNGNWVSRKGLNTVLHTCIHSMGRCALFLAENSIAHYTEAFQRERERERDCKRLYVQLGCRLTFQRFYNYSDRVSAVIAGYRSNCTAFD